MLKLVKKLRNANWAISIYPFSEKWRSESSVTQHFRRAVYEYEPYKMPSKYTSVQLTALFCNLRHLFIRLGVISLIIAPLNCRNFENSICVSKARLDLPDLNGCAPYRQPIFQLSDTRERLCRICPIEHEYRAFPKERPPKRAPMDDVL